MRDRFHYSCLSTNRAYLNKICEEQARPDLASRLVPVTRSGQIFLIDERFSETLLHFDWLQSGSYNSFDPPKCKIQWYYNPSSEQYLTRDADQVPFGFERQYFDPILSKLVIILDAPAYCEPSIRDTLFFDKPWLLLRPYYEMSKICYFNKNKRDCQRSNLSDNVGAEKRPGLRKTDRKPFSSCLPIEMLEAMVKDPLRGPLSKNQGNKYAAAAGFVEPHRRYVHQNLTNPVLAPVSDDSPTYVMPPLDNEPVDLDARMFPNLQEPKARSSISIQIDAGRCVVQSDSDVGIPNDQIQLAIKFLREHGTKWIEQRSDETEDQFYQRVFVPSKLELVYIISRELGIPEPKLTA